MSWRGYVLPTMSGAHDLFARLRDETSALHADVERLVPLLGPRVTVADYREFLALSWGFHRPLERLLGSVPGLDAVLPDWPRRQKVSRLRADLAALGMSAEALPVGHGWPALPTV